MRSRFAAFLAAMLMLFTATAAAAEPQAAAEAEEPPAVEAGTEDGEMLQEAVEPSEEAADASPLPDAELQALQTQAAETAEPEQAVIRARVAGEGALELEESGGDAIELAADGTFSVEQGSTVHVEAVPEDGSEYVMTRYNGRSVDQARAAGKRRVSFVASESGELEVTFAPRREVRLELSGEASVSMKADGQERILAPGEAASVSDGASVQFRITPPPGSSLEYASFNSRSVSAVREGDSWVLTLPIREDGTLHVETKADCTVSTILQNVELLYDEGGKWEPVKEGDHVLSLPAGRTAAFTIHPKAGCELKTLLVNGAGIDARKSGSGYRFSLRDVQGPVVITAVATQRTETVQGVDSKTGVHYRLPGSSEADASNITEDSWISVVELTSGPAYEQALAESRQYGELLSVYDLSLQNADGSYTPSVPVSISFPIPASFAGTNLKVLRASGTSLQEIPYRSEEIQGVACVTVSVADFSLYMLVDAPDGAPAAAGEVSGSSDGGIGNLAVFLALLGLSGLALLLTFRQRRTVH